LLILRLDRRENIFSFADVDAVAQLAVANAVAEVNQHPKRKPDDKPDPGEDRKAKSFGEKIEIAIL
jgi:predicted metal-dependent phosphoesterase TrpH